MRIVVLDLEWNTAFAGQARSCRRADGRQLRSEIIEVGAVRLDEKGREEAEFSAWIRPVCFRRLNPHIQEVTGRSQASLKEGKRFEQVMEDFRAFCGRDYALASWGQNDSLVLKENLLYFCGQDRLGVPLIDIQEVFALYERTGPGLQRSLAYAVEALGLERQEDYHVAVNDARYTGRVLEALLQKTDFCPERGLEIARRFGRDPDLRLQSEEAIHGIASLAELEGRLLQLRPHCPHCGRELKLQGRSWERRPKERAWPFYYKREGLCPEHGQVLCKLQLKPRQRSELNLRLCCRIKPRAIS